MRCRNCGEELRAEVDITEPGWVIFHECITRGATEKEVVERFERRSNDVANNGFNSTPPNGTAS